MALRTIRTDQDPCLYKVCRTVEHYDKRLSDLIDDMFETMYQNDGAGLAAPQVGILRRVLVMDPNENEKIALINPEIIEVSGMAGSLEGCLSFPGKSGYVERPDHVTVKGFDRNGKAVIYHLTDFAARVVQHEIDHLDGIVYLTKVTDQPKESSSEEA